RQARSQRARAGRDPSLAAVPATPQSTPRAAMRAMMRAVILAAIRAACARRSCERVGREHVLRLEVLVDPLGAALATDARLLDAAERCGGVRNDADVESHHARVQALYKPLAAREVAREDVADETV